MTPKLESKVSIEENIEIQSCSTRWVDPKTNCEPNPDPPTKPIMASKNPWLPQN